MYGEGKTFIFYTNKGDGDCALHGLNVDNFYINRQDFIQKLTNEIQNNSERERN